MFEWKSLMIGGIILCICFGLFALLIFDMITDIPKIYPLDRFSCDDINRALMTGAYVLKSEGRWFRTSYTMNDLYIHYQYRCDGDTNT